MCDPHPYKLTGKRNFFSRRCYLYITSKHFIPLKNSQSGCPRGYRTCLLIKVAWIQARLDAYLWPAIVRSLQGKAMGNHPCEKFLQKNYNAEDTLHSKGPSINYVTQHGGVTKCHKC